MHPPMAVTFYAYQRSLTLAKTWKQHKGTCCFEVNPTIYEKLAFIVGGMYHQRAFLLFGTMAAFIDLGCALVTQHGEIPCTWSTSGFQCSRSQKGSVSWMLPVMPHLQWRVSWMLSVMPQLKWTVRWISVCSFRDASLDLHRTISHPNIR